MTRHFSNIRDDIKNLEENINGIAEKTLQVLEQRNILKLNEEKEDQRKNSQKDNNINSEKHKQANMRTLKKLIVFSFFIFFCYSIILFIILMFLEILIEIEEYFVTFAN